MTYPGVALGNQWAAGFIDETGMAGKVDTPLNAAAAWMASLGSGWARFFATEAAAAALSTNVGFATIRTDTAGGWNATSKAYTIPPGGGLYVLSAGITQTSATITSLEIVGLPAGYRPVLGGASTGTAGRGEMIEHVGVRFAGGEAVALWYRGAAPTVTNVAAQTNSWFEITQIGGS